jgi:secreted PhoX family phosphatase
MSTTTDVSALDRRTFLRRGAIGAGAFWMLSLQELVGRHAQGGSAGASPYGPLEPVLDDTTGLPLLLLPAGFRYATFAWTGDTLADGVLCPAFHDGMGVIDRLPGGDEIVLVRNHEIGLGKAFAAPPAVVVSETQGGGTTNLAFDLREGRWKRGWASLAGTSRNCAGGVTPWGSWITCEETTAEGAGWCYEVGTEKGDPTPLKAMGRFSHEAIFVDPETGMLYETQDAGDASGFYKFVPNVRGDLKRGGHLFMLRVKGKPNIDLGVGYSVRTKWDVDWVRIDDPEAMSRTTFLQGRLQGAARMQRLEGAWWGDRAGYFVSTSGGAIQRGQVFEYDPRGEVLTLIYESPAAEDCSSPDNITATPRGGLLLCEDSGLPSADRLIGLAMDGTTFTFAANNVNLRVNYNSAVLAGDYRTGEFAGACYSPDGRWLFVNLQEPGITVAITGPWGRGPL